MKRLALTLFSLWCLLHTASAGTDVTVECGANCQQAVRSAMANYIADVAPVLALPYEGFDVANNADCTTRKNGEPRVFGVLIGPQYKANLALKGTDNDTELIRQAMLTRGAAPADIRKLNGEATTRDVMLKAMGSVLTCLRERDQVVLQFSGHSGINVWDYFAADRFVKTACENPDDDGVREACSLATADPAQDDLAPDKLEAIKAAFASAAEQYDTLLMLDSTSVWNETDGISAVTGITAGDISNFVTRVRNRGADAFVILDTAKAAAADLLSWQRDAAVPPGWSADSDTIVAEGGIPDPVANQAQNGTVPLFGSGEFAAFYGTAADKEASEDDQGGQGFFGNFSFRLGEALRKEGRLTFRDIAQSVSEAFQGQDVQTPVFQASSADLAFLLPRKVVIPELGKDIEIISPTPKRGAAEITERTFTLVARYTGSGKVFKAVVDGDIVDVDNNGQFRKEITDAGGKLTIAIRVLSPDLATLASTSLKLRDAEDVTEIVAAAGRKVALVIANDTYQSQAFPALKTPIADAEAVAEVLRKTFGFVTRLDDGKAPLELFLTNATKAQIQQVLFDLRRRLTAEDQLLVYYAGHGESDPDLGAYWVPVDGLPKEDFTWLAADEITRELKRMNALSVLIISDSCYAGGLSRGSNDDAPAANGRDKWLVKAARLKSRQLMASGGNEPVSDSGGSGHSVFAKALLNAFSTMPEQTFTAGELFEQKVKPAVISAATGLAEGQTPGYHRIGRAGDEPGSEFIFQRAAAPP